MLPEVFVALFSIAALALLGLGTYCLLTETPVSGVVSGSAHERGDFSGEGVLGLFGLGIVALVIALLTGLAASDGQSSDARVRTQATVSPPPDSTEIAYVALHS